MIKDFNMHNNEKIIWIAKYLLAKCGHLPKGRLVKLFYLIDWKSAITSKKTMTDLEWYYNHYGPYLPTVVDYILSDPDIKTMPISNKDLGQHLHFDNTNKFEDFSTKFLPDELKLIDSVIHSTYDLSYKEFIKLVYSTYPVRRSQKYTHLNLIEFAEEYVKNNELGPINPV